MLLHITEHKSVGALSPVSNAVRVFIDHDYHYGMFVDEAELVALLTEEHKGAYFEGQEAKLDVTIEVARRIVEIGVTPYSKPVL